MREGLDVTAGFGVSVLLFVVLGCVSSGGGKSSAAGDGSAVRPPVAAVEPTTRTIHGRELRDDYDWLRERDNDRVLAYLEAENAYTDAEMKHTVDLQEKLYEELLGRIQEDDSEPPYRRGAYLYYSRTEQGKPYAIYCRKAAADATGDAATDDDAAEEVILDVNALAEGHAFYEVGPMSVSPDHRYLAYGFDVDGSEEFTVVVKDLESGTLLEDRITGVSYSLEWANDNATFFYSIRDEATRPYKIFRHRLGSASSPDELLFHEADDAFWLGLDKTRSERYVLLGIGSSTTTEIWFLDADDPDGRFELFAPRRHEVEYRLSHADAHFYVLTNDEAKNFRLLRTRVDELDPSRWEEVIPHREDTKLELVDHFESFMVLRERTDGQRRLRVRGYDGRDDHYVEMPEKVYSLSGAPNVEFESDAYRFVYTSLVTPRTVYEYSPHSRELGILKRQEVLGGYDPRRYVTERIFATAEDGSRVPMSLVYRRGLEKNGKNPCLLYAYGSYGATIDPRFASINLSLIDRGFVYAIAHVRGGGFLGELWHDGGKMLTKRNTFTDHIAAAERLIQGGYTSSGRLAARGGSAGGLLMGAVVNLRPDLFGAVLAHVPFVDVINTMLDDSIPLTVIEYEEWGNPNEPEFFDTMLSYSPYDNVEAKDYPPMLVTAGLNDPRVQYWEPAKWVAKLRATKTDDNRLLLKTNMGAGHSGASGRYGALRETAFEWAFLLDTFGIDE